MWYRHFYISNAYRVKGCKSFPIHPILNSKGAHKLRKIRLKVNLQMLRIKDLFLHEIIGFWCQFYLSRKFYRIRCMGLLTFFFGWEIITISFEFSVRECQTLTELNPPKFFPLLVLYRATVTHSNPFFPTI